MHIRVEVKIHAKEAVKNKNYILKNKNNKRRRGEVKTLEGLSKVLKAQIKETAPTFIREKT